FLTMRDSWGSLLIKVLRIANRLYKAQLNVGKEGTNKVGQESDEEVNPYSSSVTIYETTPEGEEDESGSDNTPNPLVRLETIRLLIALASEKGWKIHHLEVKRDFINGDRTKLGSTLKDLGFLQCVQDKLVYRKVPNREFIIVVVYVDDFFMIGTCLDGIIEFKRRMASQFKMSDLGTLPITWCSQKQTTMALSSCEAEFMTVITAACQEIWLRELLAEVIVEHVSRENQRAEPLTKALARISFKEMRSLLGVQELSSSTHKFMRVFDWNDDWDILLWSTFRGNNVKENINSTRVSTQWQAFVTQRGRADHAVQIEWSMLSIDSKTSCVRMPFSQSGASSPMALEQVASNIVRREAHSSIGFERRIVGCKPNLTSAN
nr:hypothetical protein [Tanacetum cinerariifolium]